MKVLLLNNKNTKVYLLNKNVINSRVFLILSFGIILLSLLGIISNYFSQLTILQHNADNNVSKYDDNFDKNIQIQVNYILFYFYLKNEKI